jgi:membrane-bound ClpP family serine protease
MSTQADYSGEEWLEVVTAPLLAGMLVITSDPAVFGSAKESAVIAATINEYGQTSDTELIREIGRAMTAKDKPQMPKLPTSGGSDAIMKDLVNRCQSAARIVESKSPSEAEAFKAYLIDIAKKTAEASKEGGFLGIGATRVSDQEKAALSQLAEALGVTI